MAIFVSRGVAPIIPAGGLTISIGSDGKPTVKAEFHARFDVWPTWLTLMLRHLVDAKRYRKDRIAAWGVRDQETTGVAIEREFEASMQAIISSAIAIDAFYAAISAQIGDRESLAEKSKNWRDNGLARYKQVAELLRLAFKVNTCDFSAVRQNLKEIYRYRDYAVHPIGVSSPFMHHEEMGVGVLERFIYFNAMHAEMFGCVVGRLIWEFVFDRTAKDAVVKKYVESMRPTMLLLFSDPDAM